MWSPTLLEIPSRSLKHINRSFLKNASIDRMNISKEDWFGTHLSVTSTGSVNLLPMTSARNNNEWRGCGTYIRREKSFLLLCCQVLRVKNRKSHLFCETLTDKILGETVRKRENKIQKWHEFFSNSRPPLPFPASLLTPISSTFRAFLQLTAARLW